MKSTYVFIVTVLDTVLYNVKNIQRTINLVGKHDQTHRATSTYFACACDVTAALWDMVIAETA